MAARLPQPGGDAGTWGDILNDFLQTAHNSDGTLKSDAISPRPLGGISIKTATVYANCDLLADSSDIGSYDYNDPILNNTNNGALVVDGVTVTTGMRIAVTLYGSYGYTRESGIYEVTDAGSSSTPYVLTRAADANSAQTLGRVFATRITSGNSHTGNVVYFYPDNFDFTPGSTALYHAIENWNGFTESFDSLASGDFSHAEANSTASGSYSHAEGTSTASVYYAHSEGTSTASGILSHSESSSNALGRSSHAEGESQAYDNFMHSEGVYGAQFVRVVRRAYTSDSSTVQFTDDLSSAYAITLPDFFITALVTVRVVARRTDVSGTASAWTARCLIEGDGASSYRLIGDPSFSVLAQDALASSWQANDLDINGKSLKVSVNGVNGMGINWLATIELDEIHA